MNRFAELLDRLAYEPGRNNKLRLLTAYFREVEDPDRGYALAALTGALSCKHAKPGLIRDLIAARTDPVLFALSYDYVGDLSETVALMWPRSPSHAQSAPSPACAGLSGERTQVIQMIQVRSLESRVPVISKDSTAASTCYDSTKLPPDTHAACGGGLGWGQAASAVPEKE